VGSIRDRTFESIFLQGRVRCELVAGAPSSGPPVAQPQQLIIVGAFAVLLSGCGTTSYVTNARNEIATCAGDVQDEPFVNVGAGV